MGQKVNPIGLRLGINRTWDSRWYANRGDYRRLFHEDRRIRKFLKDQLKQAGVARIVIERPHKKCLESAIANAENNHNLDVDDLVVSQAFVGKALVLKRFHARARGRGARILKPFANLTIVVREVPTAEAA